jgi:hypothetical protein
MKRRLSVLSVTILAISCGVVLAPPAAARNLTYSFNVLGPNTAANPSSGASIRVTGSGSFDPVAGTIVASGSFTELNSAGSVIVHGTWNATAFVSFTSFGGPNPGSQGGQLMMTVTLFPSGGAPATDIPMSVTCLVGSPPPGAVEGVNVGDFVQVIHGRTLFHLNE